MLLTRATTATLLLSVACMFIPTAGLTQPADPAKIIPGEILLKYSRQATQADIDRITTDLGLVQLYYYRLIDAYAYRLGKQDVNAALTKYGNHPAIQCIEPNSYLDSALESNDPFLADIWAWENTGQSGGTPGADISLLNAWDVITDAGDVIVAVVDNGFSMIPHGTLPDIHPDLVDNLWVNAGEIPNNQIDDDGNGWIDDVHGYSPGMEAENKDLVHGIACSGLVGAAGNNAIGVAGAAWNVQLMLCGRGSSYDTTVAAMEYAIIMGADILSCSFGAPGTYPLMDLMVQAAREQGILIVAAAMNGGHDITYSPEYPCSYPYDNIISVAASNHNDGRPGFSNWSAVHVDVAAPGVGVLTTAGISGGYDVFSGTSCSTPIVAGVVALIKAAHPSLDYLAVRQRLFDTVDLLPAFDGLITTNGRINAFLAVATNDSVPPDPVIDLTISSTASNWFELTWTASGDDGSTGTATYYDLRYATEPINEANFADATPIADVQRPAAAGSAETLIVDDLDTETEYYVALKVRDEWGNFGQVTNISVLSNVANTTTQSPPKVIVTPGALNENVDQFGVASVSMTITNVGVGVLDYQVTDPVEWIYYDNESGHIGAGESVNVQVYLSGMGQSCGVHAETLTVTSNDPSNGQIDIPTTAYITGDAEIDVLTEFLDYGLARIDATETMSFEVYNLGCQSLPIYRITSNNREFCVLDRPTSIPAESSSVIRVAFTPARLGPASATITVTSLDEDEPAIVILAGATVVTPPDIEITPAYYVANLVSGEDDDTTVTLHNHGGYPLAFSLARNDTNDPWLTYSSESNEVSPGGTLEVGLHFSSENICEQYNIGGLVVNSNDPDEPASVFNVLMVIEPAPNISIFEGDVDFGVVQIGYAVVEDIDLGNTGCEDLTLSYSTLPSVFTLIGAPSVVIPGNQVTFTIRFKSNNPGVFSENLIITTNDPDRPTVTIHLDAVCGDDPGKADKSNIPTTVSLLPAAPNPFNPQTRIGFTMVKPGRAEVMIYDLRGHHVRTLRCDAPDGGTYYVDWNGRDSGGDPAASGVYMYRLVVDGQVRDRSKVMTLLK